MHDDMRDVEEGGEGDEGGRGGERPGEDGGEDGRGAAQVEPRGDQDDRWLQRLQQVLHQVRVQRHLEAPIEHALRVPDEHPQRNDRRRADSAQQQDGLSATQRAATMYPTVLLARDYQC